MKNRLFYVGLIYSIVFISCSKNITKDEIYTSSETISVEDALNNLNKSLYKLNIDTKSSISTERIFAIGREELSLMTKTEDSYLPDTLLYAINFSDGGYAVMAGNLKINHPVLCITESGKITTEDFKIGVKLLNSSQDTKPETIDQDYFVGLGKNYLYSLLVSSAIIDYNDTLSFNEFPETKESSSIVGPLVRTKWDQYFPFNINTPNNYPAGCAVIAVAQIMAYHEFPPIGLFETVNTGWSFLKTVYSDTNISNSGSPLVQLEVSNLVVELGNSNNCDVDYAATGSGSTVSKAKNTFENYGYDVSKHIGCVKGDMSRIDNHLSNLNPVYMQGQRKDNITGEQCGHAWVIDGYKGDMYHINWGWHGDADGYYNKGVFNTASLKSYETTDPGYNSYDGDNVRDYYHYFRYLLCTF